MISQQKPNIPYFFLLFFLLTGLFWGIYSWNEWLFMPPSSMHQWRQADGAALAWNYYKNADFFSPEIQNLQTKGDAHALGEFPLTYWIAGVISRMTGYKVWILRWVSLFFFLCGMMSYGRMIFRITGSLFRSGIVMSTLFLSPFVMYYAPNYLPDAPALGCILCAIAMGYEGLEKERKGLIIIALGFFAIAVMMKLTFLLVPVTGFILLVGFYFFPNSKYPFSTLFAAENLPKQNFLHRNRNWILLSFLFSALVIMGFRFWVSYYNKEHGSIYFLASIRPVWNYTFPEMKEIMRAVIKINLLHYASFGLYAISLLSLGAILKYRKRIPRFLLSAILLHALGNLCVFLLWFRMFREHDYYATCMMSFPLMLISIAAVYAPESVFQKHDFKKGLLILLVLVGMYQTRREMNSRLNEREVHHAYLKDTRILMEMPENWLAQKGIPENARFLCPEDRSPNTLLLGLKRKGYTYNNFGDRINRDTLQKYQVKYLVLYLALTDTTRYSPLFREYFPEQLIDIKGELRIYGKFKAF